MSSTARRAIAVALPLVIAAIAAAITVSGTEAAFTVEEESAVVTLSGGPVVVTDCAGNPRPDLAWHIPNSYPGHQLASGKVFCLWNDNNAAVTLAPQALIATNGNLFGQGLQIIMREAAPLPQITPVLGVLKGPGADIMPPGRPYPLVARGTTTQATISLAANQTTVPLQLVWELPASAGNSVAGQTVTVTLTFPKA